MCCGALRRICSRRCASAWRRRRGPARWRYRDGVSPALAAGARVLADAVPARGIEPAAALHALAGPGSVLLESGEGRWSYLAPWPAAVLSRRDPAGALEEARALLDRLAADVPAGAPPFTGGLLGSLGYDLARALEPIPQIARDDLALPAHPARGGRLAVRIRPRARRAVDRRARRARAAPPARRARARAPGGAPRGARRRAPRHALRALPRARRARARPHRARRRLRGQLHAAARGRTVPTRWISTRVCARSRPCRTTSISTRAAGSSSARRPRRSCASAPTGAARRARSRARGRATTTRLSDAALAAELATHPKDRAENVMIVDLARNDLSRVCVPGTVRVPSLCAVESHPTVHQLVSTVTGQLAPGLRRARPRRGGVRARLDDRRPEGARDAADRAARAGPPRPLRRRLRLAVARRRLRPAVVIRTAVVTRGRAYLHVGGAIVADSDPAEEYEESLVKARTVAGAARRNRHP